jgi:hypothetical protein
MIALGLALSALLTVTPIPKNFLLTEPGARKPQTEMEADEVWWKISDKRGKQLELNPCAHKGTSVAGRVAARTVTHSDSGPSNSSEQLVIYDSAEAADKALTRLRADVRNCAAHRWGPRANWNSTKGYRYVGRPAKLADGALWVKGQVHEKHRRWYSYDWFLAARRGSALMIYTVDSGAATGDRDALKQLSRDVRKMSVKVCELPGVCADAPAPAAR